MKKPGIRFLLILILITIISLGCSKSSKDKLIDAYKKTWEIKSLENTSQIKVNYELKEKTDDPMLDFILSLLNGTSVTMDSKISREKALEESILTIGALGYDMEGKAFFHNEILAIRLPLFTSILGVGDKYLLIDMNQIKEKESTLYPFLYPFLPKQNNELVRKVQNKIIINMIKKNLANNFISETDKNELETPEGIVKGAEYHIELASEEIKILIKNLLNDFLNNNILKDQTLSAIMELKVIKEKGLSEEEIINNPENVVSLLLDNKEINLDMKYFVDEDKFIRNTNLEMQVVSLENNNNNLEKLTLLFNQTIWGINQDKKIQIPEFNDENSIKADKIIEMLQ